MDFVKSNKRKIKFYAKAIVPKAENNYITVGHGKISNYICGTTTEVYACECNSEIHYKHKSCNHLECPICFKIALYKRSKKILERIWGIAQHRKEQLFHVVIAPPEHMHEKILESPDKFQREILYPIINKHSSGGMIMYHQHRIDYITKELYLSPHYHMIIANSKNMAFDLNGGDMKDKYDMIFSTKQNRKTGSYKLESVDDIQSVAYYQLSHASYKRGSIAYKYIGKYANCKNSVKNAEYQEEIRYCETCLTPITEIIEYEILEFHYNDACSYRLAYLSYYKDRWRCKKCSIKDWNKMMEYDKLTEYKIIDKIRVIKRSLGNYATKEILFSVEVFNPGSTESFKYLNNNTNINNIKK